jgi:hypothetical protein
MKVKLFTHMTFEGKRMAAGGVYDLPAVIANTLIAGKSAEPVEPENDIEDLEESGINELRKMAKEAGIKGYNRMKKSELVEELTKIEDEKTNVPDDGETPENPVTPEGGENNEPQE